MKNKSAILLSAILFSAVLTFISCSDEKQTQLEVENSKRMPTYSSNDLKSTCRSTDKVGGADPRYNCFGFAFSVSETGILNFWLPSYIEDHFFDNDLFVFDDGPTASKVFYWETSVEVGNISTSHHAAIITDWNGGLCDVRSKCQVDDLYDHCLTYDASLQKTTNFYERYGLNMKNLTVSGFSPVRGKEFFLSVPADGSSIGVEYIWIYDHSQITRLVGYPAYKPKFRIRDDAPGGTIEISVLATHQKVKTGPDNKAFPKTIEIEYPFKFRLPPLPLGVSVSGPLCSPQSAQTCTWTAVTTGGTLPFTYKWTYRIYRGIRQIPGTSTSNTLSVYLLPTDRMNCTLVVKDSDETAYKSFFVSNDCLPVD